jgi:hypothetical protein
MRLLSFALAIPLSHLSVWSPAARAERFVSAYDPRLQVKPPTMRGVDGSSGELVFTAGFAERAAAFRRRNPGYFPAQADVVQVGEVVVVEGSEEVISTDGNQVQVEMEVVARKVIEKFGDHFQAMTMWLTFDETVSSQAGAYEYTVKADVRGLGIPQKDNSAMFGSNGMLRSVLNMKRVWQGVNQDTEAAWRPLLEIWGQESGHRWMVFMRFRDPRTGLPSDALLGRDCSHYSRFVDTQGSVHDGLAWTDNRDGTFTAATDRTFQFGNLDLYGMGLMPAEEMPSFFFIDDVPGYQRGSCREYFNSPKPLGNKISGTRVEVTIDDVIAVNGPRIPSSDELLSDRRQDYFREVQVVVTRPGETASSPLAMQVAQRIDRARLLWERWMLEATRNRMVVCTQVSRDCGDPRSDVVDLRFNPGQRAPSWGPLPVEVTVENTGERDATGVKVSLETRAEGRTETLIQAVGALAVGASRKVGFNVDLRGIACGAELAVKASTQGDFHYHRKLQHLVLGAEARAQDGFENDSGWRVNPDGDDGSLGAVWERGTPERTEIIVGSAVQPAGAHDGTGAWVTGAAARGPRDAYVRSGRTTLESPVFDARDWREPRVRFWTTFAGMKAAPAGLGVVASDLSRLRVLARAVAEDGSGAGDWVEIDRLENEMTIGWVLRSVALPRDLEGKRIKVRFVAEDANPQNGGVEAAIDDFEITSNLPACYQPPPPSPRSGGCTLGAGPAAPPALGLLLVALWVVVRRRRAP